MIETKVFNNLEEALQLYAELGDKLEPEMAMASNRAMRGVKTDVTKQIAKTRGVKRSELKDWKFRNARPGDMEALAVIAGKRLPVDMFGPSPSSVMTGRTSGGVSVSLAGKSVIFRHAFVGRVYDAQPQVLQRKPGATPKQDFYVKAGERKRLKGRFPLNRLFFVSVAQMADDDDVVDIVVKNAQGRVLSQFDHLIDRLLKGYA